jgi:hypothetical protein
MLQVAFPGGARSTPRDEECVAGDEQAGRDEVAGAGLCGACAWQRVITSDRGSAFSMCTRAAEDARLRKYPTLPVLRCVGFDVRTGVAGGSAG